MLRSDFVLEAPLGTGTRDLYRGRGCSVKWLPAMWTLITQLQRWLYWREHLKYVWNVYCVATNHRWDLHTTETTGNDSFRSVMEQIIFVLFKDTNYLIRNLKHRCSPRSVPRTASSTSFDFRKKSFRSQCDATATSFPCKDISHEDNKKWTIVMFSFLIA